MSVPSIDFRLIRSFGGSQQYAFEELCCQLASLDPRPKKSRFVRKGIGGDAGVECFIKAADGSETGWQAKYIFDLDAGQLDKSIKQALEKHPSLDRYVVCLPFDLSDARGKGQRTALGKWDDWVAKWQASAKKKGRRLKIELWSRSAIVERLGRGGPLYAGRIVFWFNETVLSPSWFAQRFAAAKAGLGDRYTPATSIDLPIRRTLLAFCRDPALFDEVQQWHVRLEEARPRPRDWAYARTLIEKWDLDLARIDQAAASLADKVSVMQQDPLGQLPVALLQEALRDLHRLVREAYGRVWAIRPDAAEDDTHKRLQFCLNRLQDLIYDWSDDLSSERWQVANVRRLLVDGVAGAGKSHLFGDAADHQIKQERPAILVLGGTLVAGDPWTQIVRDTLGLTCSKDEFLGALDAAGQAAGTRAVIFVDALNEHHGLDIWPERLAAFLQEINRFPHVAIAVSCRSTYRRYIIGDAAQLALTSITHEGFAGQAAYAARLYLRKRGIVRMAAPNPVPEFENPLFLKTCCDLLDATGKREFPLGLRGVTRIFDFYAKALCEKIELRLRLDPDQQIVRRALQALADRFAAKGEGYIPYGEAVELLDQIRPSAGRADGLLPQLLSEGILADEVIGNRSDAQKLVRFTFERFSDHQIAERLLELHFDAKDPKRAFLPGKPLHTYVAGEGAFRRAGVIEALAIQVPDRSEAELPDLLPEEVSGRSWIIRAFENSLRWRDHNTFRPRTLELVQARGTEFLLKTLIAIATEPDNQFNALYLHGRLAGLTMPERDAEWSAHLLREGDDADHPVQSLIEWTLDNGLEEIDPERVDLIGTALCWLFTTSHREVRDRATKALVTLLIKRLALAGRLVTRFISVNDLYVLERIMAAAYGAVMQGQSTEGLSELANTIYRTLFAAGRPMPHVMVRDYARGIVEYAVALKTPLPTINLKLVRPPYDSEWPIEEVSQADLAPYKETYGEGEQFDDDIVSSAVNDGDFARYVSDGSIDAFSSLSIELAGKDQESLVEMWVGALSKEAMEKLMHLEGVCARWRTEAPAWGTFRWILSGEKPPDNVYEQRASVELEIDEAEQALRAELGEAGWSAYCDLARAYVRRDLWGLKSSYSWPPSFGAARARRWIAKRAHDLGWTNERFSSIDRRIGHGDRYEHRRERIGKKYQWLALHELIARLGDNVAYKDRFGSQGLTVFQGPWQVGRRDMDLSLLTDAKPEGRRSEARSWWIPRLPALRPTSLSARLSWLWSKDDFIEDPTPFIVQKHSDRNWLVLDEFLSWRCKSLFDGKERTERQAWTSIKCVLVRQPDRRRAIEYFLKQGYQDRDALSRLDITSYAYWGEYYWHPIFADVPVWIGPGGYHNFPCALQPTTIDFSVSRSGHDYSIAESISCRIPAPGLHRGLALRLTSGRELAYSDTSAKTVFFDPSTIEPGPSAALVDQDAFQTFLAQEKLKALWIVSTNKEVHGPHPGPSGTFGGAHALHSVFWQGANGRFERIDRHDREEPTEEQIAALFKSEGMASL